MTFGLFASLDNSTILALSVRKVVILLGLVGATVLSFGHLEHFALE